MLLIGFFDHFQTPTLLMAGDKGGLLSLASALRTLADESTRQLSCDTIDYAESRIRLPLYAKVVDRYRHTGYKAEFGNYAWCRTLDGWREASQRIDQLARRLMPGAVEFDSSDKSVVVVSKGIYGIGWWDAMDVFRRSR